MSIKISTSPSGVKNLVIAPPCDDCGFAIVSVQHDHHMSEVFVKCRTVDGQMVFTPYVPGLGHKPKAWIASHGTDTVLFGPVITVGQPITMHMSLALDEPTYDLGIVKGFEIFNC